MVKLNPNHKAEPKAETKLMLRKETRRNLPAARLGLMAGGRWSDEQSLAYGVR
jgi:hypothetical protein